MLGETLDYLNLRIVSMAGAGHGNVMRVYLTKCSSQLI
jgi:hypothetical protein